MTGIKQDMPPPGGFASITYQRIPLKQPWPGPVKWLLSFAVMGVGWYGYSLDKKRLYYEEIEKRAANFSVLPLMAAENDRKRLKMFVKARKQEADLMKDVEGWEVGTYFGQPIYKSLKPSEWYEPHFMEPWIYTDQKLVEYLVNFRLLY